MKMNEFVTRAKFEDVAHTSGYARLQNGASFGASGGGRTFAQRQAVDYRNSRVKQYSQSILGRNDMTRRGAVLESVNSTRDRILANRQIREENSNFGENRRSSALSKNQIEKTTQRAMARNSSLKSRMNGVAQSGMAGFHAGGASSAPKSSGGFFSVKPKF